MRRYHLVIVTALVGAITACLMVRTPNASASSESVTYIPSQSEAARPSLLIAQAEPTPEGDAAPEAPANDPVLNEALAQEKEPEAPAPKEEKAMEKPAKPLKDAKAFAQEPKSSRKAAGTKSKKSNKAKAKKTAKHPKKKKKQKKA